MNHFEARLKKIEEILIPKKRIILILDEITSEPESWMEVNGEKYIIPPDVDVKEFVREKAKLAKDILICGLYLSKDRAKKPYADYSGLKSKERIGNEK
jgi:hypothetical protein